MLCNVLVCLAVWLSFAARSLTDKVLAVLFPVSAFVVSGFEHSVANMYAIPIAMLGGLIEPDWLGFFINLAVVSAGNILGGGVLVALRIGPSTFAGAISRARFERQRSPVPPSG